MSNEKDGSTHPDLTLAIIGTLIAVALWILFIVDPNWVKSAQYLAVFLTLVAISGWIRYAIARRRQARR